MIPVVNTLKTYLGGALYSDKYPYIALGSTWEWVTDRRNGEARIGRISDGVLEFTDVPMDTEIEILIFPYNVSV